MFLKITSALPGYIYSYDRDKIFVNLFIGSDTRIQLNDGNVFRLKQETHYPWDSKIILTVDPEKTGEYIINVRIPGWAQGKENTNDLYYSDLKAPVSLQVNGRPLEINIANGYAEIKREWEKGIKSSYHCPCNRESYEPIKQLRI